MRSLVPGYEYDIFISYRQKDNKYDGWVTEFVSNLEHELESSFPEEVNVYFDHNPIDGLLENHDVDDSLKMKLRCLIFIPVISRTYCDARSFAWEHEFKTFINEASRDQFGLKIKLQNGNVASRVLPVRIYDLDRKSVELCEELAGGPLRGIDFVYKSPGVNRPLRANEDHPVENSGKIYYRDQINKLANSISEILEAVIYHEPLIASENKSGLQPHFKKKKKLSLLLILSAILLIVLAGFFIFTDVFERNTEKSIAVLPFRDNSNVGIDFPVDGMCEEITNKLFMVGEMNVPGYSSTMIYKGLGQTNREIARELKVSHLLVGSVTRSGNRIKVSATLIDGRTGRMKWTEDYSPGGNETDYFEIISDIANRVVRSLKIVLAPSVEDRINMRPTTNKEAYELYLQAKKPPIHQDDYSDVRKLLERAIALDPQFADAYAELGFWWVHQGGYGGSLSREEVLMKSTSCLSKALEIDSNSVIAHYSNALLNLYYVWDFKTVEEEYNTVRRLAPSKPDMISFFVDYLIASGKSDEALSIAKKAFEKNSESPDSYVIMALTNYFNNKSDSADSYLSKALIKYPDFENLIVNSLRLYNYMGMYNKTVNLYRTKSTNNDSLNRMPYVQGHYAIALQNEGYTKEADSILVKLIVESEKTNTGSPLFFVSAIYTAKGQTDEAFSYLEKALDRKEVEMYWLRVEPLFTTLRGDPRFEKLVSRIKY